LIRKQISKNGKDSSNARPADTAHAYDSQVVTASKNLKTDDVITTYTQNNKKKKKKNNVKNDKKEKSKRKNKSKKTLTGSDTKTSVPQVGPFRSYSPEKTYSVDEHSIVKLPDVSVALNEKSVRAASPFEEVIAVVFEEHKAELSVRKSAHFKTPKILTVNTNAVDVKETRNAMMDKKQRAALERRAKIEEKRKDRERQKRAALEEEERRKRFEEDLAKEAARRAEEKQRLLEADEMRMHEELQRRERDKAEKEIQAEKRRSEKQAMLRRMSMLLAEREAELQLKLAKEKLAREIEEALRKKEEEILAAMAESDRLTYLAEREADEQKRRYEEERKEKQLALQRILEENERQRELKELENLQMHLLNQKYINNSFRRGNELLWLSREISRAYSYSYFTQLPIILSIKGAEGKSGYRVKRNLPSLSELMEEIKENSA